MREILFKAKRTEKQEWVEGSLFVDPDLKSTFIYGFDYPCGENGIEREEFSHEVSPSTVCQYTGLTDKNGTKIFEGDIVEAGYYKWKCQVVWDEKCARFICFTIEGERRIVYVDMVDKNDVSAIAVIGNIHDKENKHNV